MFGDQNTQANPMSPAARPSGNRSASDSLSTPSIELPRGGGAIKGIEEKFQVNAVTGTSSFSIPFPVSASRAFTPGLGLVYNSGNGNGAFGMGWDIPCPSIKRKTEKELPVYKDEIESDTFIFSGAEDLIPILEKDVNGWKKKSAPANENGRSYTVVRYRPRIEGSFARIERWTDDQTGEMHWHTISTTNIHSYYGLSDKSRIADPDNPAKIFEWLLCRVHDDKGNISEYEYKKEDLSSIPNKLNEVNRKAVQVYLKKVLYGNSTPYFKGDNLPGEHDYLFQLVLDYGEHDATDPVPLNVWKESQPWKTRKDPFSTHKPGFEIRTYRRCERVLMFHCFDQPDLPVRPYLVRSLHLIYDDDIRLGNNSVLSGYSFLVKAHQQGYIWDAASNHYRSKALPDIEFTYQPIAWNTEVKAVDRVSIANAPAGIDQKRTLWIDLFNEGIAGLLTEEGGGWYYKYNLGNGKFLKAVPIGYKPGFSGLMNGRISIQELEGNGIKYLVHHSQPIGFFKLSGDENWEPFKPFPSYPSLRFNDTNTRLIDVNGDNRADLIVDEDNGFRVYENQGENGFVVSRKIRKEIDEEKGPAVIFSDRVQSIFLADMNGDGLTDIVRIKNKEICYWPNLGGGYFGGKVNMDNAPEFDTPDLYNPSYLRLADIDGSGTTDLVYLGKNNFRVWMNLSGNEWSVSPQVINHFPSINQLSDVSVLDFLGTGTACIVHSTKEPDGAICPLHFIDLMDGQKPHLLTRYHNNCGKEITLHYKSSVQYYLEDKLAGKKWITKLPFVVHCIDIVRSEDKILNTVFINSYRYRHGYYDFLEKEFRGFARVEREDTEQYSLFRLNQAKNVVDESLHEPPSKTISWFHTGAFFGRDRILHQCKEEYFKNNFFAEYELPEPLIPDGLSDEEFREALRACKGLPLRTETYSNDGSDKTNLPYSVSGASYEIRCLQVRAINKYGCFQVIPSESVGFSYERNPEDPRISQSYILETNELGYVTKSASVVYPRVKRPMGDNAVPDRVWNEQKKFHILYGETDYTDDIIENDLLRLRIPFENRAYEVSGITQPAGFYFDKKTLAGEIALSNAILFEKEFTGGQREKRLHSHNRTYFINQNFDGPLALGLSSRLGIPFRQYKLSFTRDLVKKYYDTKVDDAMLTAAGYVHLEGDKDWWAYSGTEIYSANPRNDFFVPIGSRDVFGNESFIDYDRYKLLAVRSVDAIGNSTLAQNEYRTLSPGMVTDPNLNRAGVETDELGFTIKSAVMGKAGAGEGDVLSDPTMRMEYELFNWQSHGKPNFVHSFHKVKHGAGNTRWVEAYTYSDGGGGVVMNKLQAKPGKARRWNPVSKAVEEIEVEERWTGSGRAIFNNKGNVVKQFEPYFSTTFDYENEDELVETGKTAIYFYDAAGRLFKTKFPDGSFSKIQFDNWFFKAYDVNDTVKDSEWYVLRGSPDPAGPEPADPEKRAAWLAAKHHDTPVLDHLDSLGRSLYTRIDYGEGKTTHVFAESDLAGRISLAFDQLERKVSESYINLSGETIYIKTAEKGEKWMFTDVMGRLVKVWDNNQREFRSTFDKLHRHLSSFVKENGKEILFTHAVYGDILPNADQKNMKGQAYQLYDQAGLMTINEIDFKGNVLDAERRLAKEYKETVNWNALEGLVDINEINDTADPLLEKERFVSFAQVDALNRPSLVTLADGSVFQSTYNQAHYMETLSVKIRGEGDFVPFLMTQDYDEKGRRQFVKYGNGLITRYFYDPSSFRLTQLLTGEENAADSKAVQNIFYTYDPVGNITQCRDLAQQTHFFKNTVVFPESKFEYDAVYQLKKASGREHAGMGANVQRDHRDLPYIAELPQANDLAAVRNYTEQYQYDDCGNILRIQHIASNAQWTTRFRYHYQDDPSNLTNRLKSTSMPGDPDDGPYTSVYVHDEGGHMTSMPHLPAANSLGWNFIDQLREVNLGGGGRAYYVYSMGGSRTRKIIERIGGKKLERIYLGGLEIYREYLNNTKTFERNTLFVADHCGRIAQVDTKLFDPDQTDPANPLLENLIRYQYSNAINSASVETDRDGNVISYEEYHPYGTTAYRNSKSTSDLSLKRYRFCGKEKDEETGFYYYGDRFYAPWLGRWTSTDPEGFTDGQNFFRFCLNNPVMYNDPTGTQTVEKKSFGLPGYAKIGKDATDADISAAASKLRDYVEGLHYKWSRDGVSNPAPEYDRDTGRWTFGEFDPDSIPQSDPLGITDKKTSRAGKGGKKGSGGSKGKGEGGKKDGGGGESKGGVKGGKDGGVEGGKPGGKEGGVKGGDPKGKEGGDPKGSPDGDPNGSPEGKIGGKDGGGNGNGGGGKEGGVKGGDPNGDPNGKPGGNPGGTPGGTGTEVNPGGSGSGSGTGTGGRSFWSRGGSTLLLGLGILALGLLTVATGGGALIMFSAGMAIGAGATVAIGSGILLAASYSGHTTAEEDARWTGALSDAALVASSPGSAIGGGIGYAINGEKGMRTGALIGGLSEAGLSLGIAGFRAYALKAGPGLGNLGREVTLAEWQAMSAAERKLYEYGQTTVRQAVWNAMVKAGISDNPIAKGEYLLKTFGGRLGIFLRASNPFKLISTWKTGGTPAAAYLAPALTNGVTKAGATSISAGMSAASNMGQ